jgi:hypothetical protein
VIIDTFYVNSSEGIFLGGVFLKNNPRKGERGDEILILSPKYTRNPHSKLLNWRTAEEVNLNDFTEDEISEKFKRLFRKQHDSD